MGNTLIILLPLVALILAAVSIAALWYWWTSGQDEGTEQQQAVPVSETQPQETPQPQSAEPTVGDLFGKVTTTAQSWMAHIAKGPSTPAAGSAPTSGYSPAMSAFPSSDGEMVEVLKVLRDLADGSLVVEIGGRRYRSMAEISDPQVKRRFTGNAQALSQFAQVETSVQPPAAMWSTPTPEPAASPFAPPQPMVPPPPAVSPSLPLPQAAGAAEAASAPADGLKTIADEIEEMIQYRLSTTPELRYRSIHIRSAIGDGIRVEVDGRFFDSVADVTEPEVMAFLQSVIREWEARA